MEREPRYPSSREIIDLEALIEKNETEISELSENFSQLLENQRSFIEYYCVLQQAEIFFTEENPSFEYDGDDDQNYRLHFVAGVVDIERYNGFERMLWRVSHGNVLMKQMTIDQLFRDPKTGKDVLKLVFIAFFQGDQLKPKIRKVCDGYRATIFPYPSGQHERWEVMRGLRTRIADMATVVNKTKDHRMRVLRKSANYYNEWRVKLKKLKAIYHTLNLFNMNVSNKCLIGECWVPTSDINKIQNLLKNGSEASTISTLINVIGTDEIPPTLNRTNKFTVGFQNLIESYGIASYREVNPGFFTIITFPFLFAIMYGDVGHGLIIFLIALWMIFSETKLEKIKSEIFRIFFVGRYIILLMGIFSIYTGLIYNDVFSKSMNIFGSSWRINYNITTVMSLEENEMLQLNPSTDDLMVDRTYPFGIDPIWALADNKILFLNSYKMKLSIIFGVVHMLLGVCVSVINFRSFRRNISIVLEFLPQVLFLVLLFGYLVFMMFFKWVRFSPKAEQPYSPGCAPSVLVYFINMILFGKEKPLDGCDAFMYSGQKYVQYVLLVLGVLCIPWMLCGKPIYIMIRRRKRNRISTEEEFGERSQDEEEPMSEIWTHQAIHTIEYVLGTVSHTASYLRLWALSLAHARKLLTRNFLNIRKFKC